MSAVEATETFLHKALFPQSNCIDAAAHLPTGMGLSVASRQTQPRSRSDFGLDSSALFFPAAKSRCVQTPSLFTQSTIRNQCNSALAVIQKDSLTLFKFAKLQESEAVMPFKKVNPSEASCSGESANLRQMQQSLAIFLKLGSKDSIVTTP
jgi:hypothetical protein